MADPARYTVWPSDGKNGDLTFPELCITRSEHGMWIKWADFKDYKAGQRTSKTLEAVTRIGIEIAEVRSQLADLEAENERLRKHLDFFREKFDAKSNKLMAQILKDAEKFAVKEGSDAK